MKHDDDPTNYKAIHRTIKDLWQSGPVGYWGHAKIRMTERHLSRADIGNVVRYGRIVEHSYSGTQWRWKIQGTSLDGRLSSVVVEIQNGLIIVTVIA